MCFSYVTWIVLSTSLAMHTVPSRLSSAPAQLFHPHCSSLTTSCSMERRQSCFAVWWLTSGCWWQECLWPSQPHRQRTASGGLCRQCSCLAYCELYCSVYITWHINLTQEVHIILFLCNVCVTTSQPTIEVMHDFIYRSVKVAPLVEFHYWEIVEANVVMCQHIVGYLYVFISVSWAGHQMIYIDKWAMSTSRNN